MKKLKLTLLLVLLSGCAMSNEEAEVASRVWAEKLGLEVTGVACGQSGWAAGLRDCWVHTSTSFIELVCGSKSDGCHDPSGGRQHARRP